MISNFKQWKKLYESGHGKINYSIFEEIGSNNPDHNALLIKLLGNPVTRPTVYKRINAILLSKYVNNPKINPNSLIIDLNKMNPDARIFFDDDNPPKIIIKTSSITAVDTEESGKATEKAGGILNVFKNKRKLSEGWVGVGFNYSLDITIDEIILNTMFENEEDRKISGINGIGLLRGRLVKTEELDDKGKPKYITEWEILDMGINFTKKLDQYTFSCASVPSDQLSGKNLASGEPIVPENLISANAFSIKKGEKNIYGPTYFLSSQLLPPDQKTFKLDLNDLEG